MNKLVSIIVPIYNSEQYLRKCLDSIKQQSYKKIEIILIDDGSTDNSAIVAREYCEKDERFTLIQIKNSGSSNARNIGLKRARGRYIGFVDSDDVIEPNMYEELVNVLENNPAYLFACCNFDNNCEEKGDLQYNSKINKIDGHVLNHLLVDKRMQGFVWNKLFRAETIRGIEFDARIAAHEDLMFNFKVLEKNGNDNIIFIDEVLYHYRINTDGCMFSKKFSRKKLTALEVYSYLLENTDKTDIEAIKCIKTHFVLVCLILASNIIKYGEISDIKYLKYIYVYMDKYKNEIGKLPIKYRVGLKVYCLNKKIFELILKLI